MEMMPNLPDDAPMSDVTSPDSPLTVDPADPVTVGAPTESDASGPVDRDDPAIVGVPDQREDEGAPSTDTGPTAGSEMGGDRI